MPRFNLLRSPLWAVLCYLAFQTPRVYAAQRVSSGVSAQSTQLFRSLGLLGQKASVERVRIGAPEALPKAAKTTVSATAVHAADAPLTFDYTGYTSTEKAVLSNFIRLNYARMVGIFGAPAPEQSGKVVHVVGNVANAAAIYSPPLTDASGGGTIYFHYADGDSDQINTYSFTRLVMLSFYGPRVFSTDFKNGQYIEAWLNGFSDAAALLVAYGAAGSPSDFDPSQIGTYVLPVYDLFNRPELGNAYIYPLSGDYLVISDFRIGMAQAAWLKVAVENPLFFANFNKAYYQQSTARQAIDPNTLRSIAAGVVPTVEGLGFNDWIRRQYVLDTSVTTGQKLYAAALPLPILGSGDQRSGFNGFAEAFTTDSTGNETASTGYGTVAAYDDSGNNINSYSRELTSSNVLSFNDTSSPGQATFGAGFNAFTQPNQARVTLKLRFQQAEATTYFPYIASTKATSTTYYGVTTGLNTGTIALSATSNQGSKSSSLSESIAVAHGGWAGAKAYLTGDRVITKLALGGTTFTRNTAWLISGNNARGVGLVLEAAPANNSFALKTAAGGSTLRMISLPVFPTKSDEADILGIAKDKLQLARYRPNLQPTSIQGGVLQFGIGSDRHEIYPNISAPMAPGRGYWIGVNNVFQTTIQGGEPPRDKPYEVPLLGGWNQIGVPFNSAFTPDSIKVRYGGFSPVPFATAIQNGWVSPGIWGWLARGGYTRIDGVAGAKLEPFQGYYIFASPLKGVSLVFDPSVSTTPSPVTEGWSVPLTAATNQNSDASNAFGVSTRIAAAKPPTAAKVVTLRFLSNGTATSSGNGSGAATGWADSFLPTLEREGKWNFAIDGVDKGQVVTLAWGDLAKVPSDIKLVLLDQVANRQLALVAHGSFKFTSAGVPRQLTLTATRTLKSALVAQASPSNGIKAVLTLNMAASGRLEIQDSKANTIATLKTGAFAVGGNQFPWSGLQSNGKVAPKGNYRLVWIPSLASDKGAAVSFSRS